MDTTRYPTVPANETAARQQFMDLFNQLRDHLNNKMSEKTISNFTLYVDATVGNDANDGLAVGAGRALKTIQEAIRRVPKSVLHAVYIDVANGVYSEDVVLGGFSGNGTLFLRGNLNDRSQVKVQSVAVIGCAMNVTVQAITSQSNQRHGFLVDRSIGTVIQNCDCNTDGKPYTVSGCLFQSSLGVVAFSGFNNRYVGLWAQGASSVFANQNAGAGNTYGYVSEEGATIGRYLGSLTGTTEVSNGTGGVIR